MLALFEIVPIKVIVKTPPSETLFEYQETVRFKGDFVMKELD